MKKLIFIAMLILAFNSLVAQGTPGLEFTLINNGTAYEVRKGTADAEHIEIPNTYEGLPVTKIAESAFLFFETMTSVHIPDGVTHIGYSTFSSCTGL